ncbi:MAG: hypothetical protein ACFCUE_04600 [Candidatus Bathyarchaeia archaeon]|jgi:lipopolysaccharide export LptBFGC system permease protein LptF
MLKKNAAITTTVLMVILGISFVGTAFAQTYTPGVSVGNVFKYQYTLSTNVTGTNQASIPSPFDALVEQAETIDYIQITVTGVSGSVVTAQVLTQFKAGNQQTFTGTVDVATGQGTLAQFFIAANLTANNPLSMGSTEKINGTTTKTYTSGIQREVNYQNITTQTTVPASEVARYNITVPLNQVNTQEADWDKQTGVLSQIAYSMQTTSTQINATLTLNLNLVESNVFAVPEYPILLIVMIAMAVPTVAVLRKSKKSN